jgi:hypothetical protein
MLCLAILLAHFFFLCEDVVPIQVIVEVSGFTRSNLSLVESQIKICEGPRWEFIVASRVWCLVSVSRFESGGANVYAYHPI